MFYSSLKFLPSSKATLISSLHPLLVSICGYFFLKESLTKVDVIAVFGAFFGVLIMNLNKTDSTKIETSEYLTSLGIILCSITVFLGVGVTLTIRLMNKHLHYLMNPAYFAFTLMFMALCLLVAYPSIYNFEYYTVADVAIMAVSGFIHFVAQNIISIAFKYEEASKISPLSYSVGVYLMISDFFIFGYLFSFTDVIGAGMVICFLLSPIIYKVWILKNN